MTVYEALIKDVPGKSSPDFYDSKLGRPPTTFVVTRDVDGSPLSLYGDMVWDRSPYTSGENTNLYFQFWEQGDISPIRSALAEELRWIMFLLIWCHPARRTTATKTLNSNLYALRALARRAEANGISIGEALRDKNFMRATPDFQSPAISKILGILHFLGIENSGFEVAPDTIPFLGDAAIAYQKGLKQTAPIPTRIYSTILSDLTAEIAKLRPVIGKLCAIYSELKSRPSIGSKRTAQAKRVPRADTFEDLLQRYELIEFWTSTRHSTSILALGPALREIQILISLQIQAYTGMRAEEVRYLPHSCLEQCNRGGDSRIHYIVSGTSTKLNAGKEHPTQWVTIDAAAEAIGMAQELARAIYAAEGVEINQLNSRKKGSFLFPRSNCDGKPRGEGFLQAQPAILRPTARIDSILSPIILEEDQQELFTIDPHRQWNMERRYLVGTAWHLTGHQLRRSLALYAQSSGLVSLPSLKRQLQHITVEMSLYYARGSAFSRNFIGERQSNAERHFGDEWQDTQPISQFIAYASSILLTDESDIFGGHGQWLKTHKRDKNGQIKLNRTETIRSFQKGEIAYRPTPLGGCVSLVSCDKIPIHVLSAECISTDCKNLIADARKVEKIIFIKSGTIRKLKELAPLSAELRIEEAELNALQTGLARARK